MPVFACVRVHSYAYRNFYLELFIYLSSILLFIICHNNIAQSRCINMICWYEQSTPTPWMVHFTQTNYCIKYEWNVFKNVYKCTMAIIFPVTRWSNRIANKKVWIFQICFKSICISCSGRLICWIYQTTTEEKKGGTK